MLLFSAFFVIQIVLTAFVAIPGRSKSYKAEHAQSWSKNDEGCIGLCSRLPICQAYYFNNSTKTCITYDYDELFTFVQLETFPVTEIFFFKTNITTCSNSLASVYFSYSTNYSKTYKYTRTGNDWEVQGV
ncbi:unnamed protein product [Caenorhabditis angaria]|uniref:PAN-3 domain-containing protein n=1 Tax=Caenorhabditis angaria TaxID=860376 RepID=A0A9P1N004_9PELO|nr:unnamed protein product [Caenorhabditis angaria]